MKDFPPKRIFIGILGIISILLLLHIVTYLNLLQNNLDPESYFFRKLNFDTERNIPSIFSGLLHFTSSILLARIALNRLSIKNRRWFWGLLSFTFLFLGVDEIFGIHEEVKGNLSILEEKGSFLYNWSLVYLTGTFFLFVGILRPLLSLPRKVLYRFLLAGFIFIFGATILEGIAGNIVFQRGLAPEDVKTDPVIFILATFEELFEMLGVSLFIYALLDFLDKFSLAAVVRDEPKAI